MLFFPMGMDAAGRFGGKLSDRMHPKLSAGIDASIVLIGLLFYMSLNPKWAPYEMMSRMVDRFRPRLVCRA
jgi:hypothetical protein